jgi:hypothetical protein
MEIPPGVGVYRQPKVTFSHLGTTLHKELKGVEVTAVIEQGKKRPIGIEADDADTGHSHPEPAKLRCGYTDNRTKNRSQYEVVAYHHDGAVPVLLCSFLYTTTCLSSSHR